MNTEERNSVEKGAHRRRAPASVKVCFAGAGARWGCVPPTSPRSPEDSLRPHAQLRQTFPHRRKTNTEEPNSVEKPPHRRRAPAPVRVCFAGAGTRWGVRTSDEPSFVGGQPASACSAPANIISQEKDEYRSAQLRREGRSPEERTSFG